MLNLHRYDIKIVGEHRGEMVRWSLRKMILTYSGHNGQNGSVAVGGIGNLAR